MTISAEYPFESRYVKVLGSKMHYIEEGEGQAHRYFSDFSPLSNRNAFLIR